MAGVQQIHKLTGDTGVSTLCRLGVEPSSQEGKLCVPCCGCEGDAYIHGDVIWCPSGCRFGSGDISDYLADAKFQGDYTRLAEALGVVATSAAYWKARRWLTRRARRGLPLRDMRLSETQLRAISKRLDMLPVGEGGHHVLMSREDVANLRKAARVVDARMILKAEVQECLALPLWESPWRCAGYLFFDKKGVQIGEFLAANLNWYLTHLESDSMTVYPFVASVGYRETTKRNADSYRRARDNHHHGLCRGSGDERLSWIPRHVYMDPPESISDTAALADFDKRYPEVLRVILPARLDGETMQEVLWNKFLEIRCMDSLMEDATGNTALRLLEAANPTFDCVGVLAKAFRDGGYPNLANTVTARFSTNEIEDLGDEQVVSTSDGYHIRNKSTRVMRRLTNFTVAVTNNVVFTGSSDVYHRTLVACEGDSKVVDLSEHDLQNAQTLQSAARIEYVSQEGMDAQALPYVVDPALTRKHVIPWIRRQAVVARSVTGIDWVGWSLDRRTFQTTWGRINDGVLVEESGPTRPDIRVFRNFGAPLITAASVWMGDDIPTDLHAAALALMCRGYERLETGAITVEDTLKSRRILEGIAAAFGQRQVFDANSDPQILSGVNGLRGLPLVIDGLTKRQTLDIRYPVIALCRDGDYSLSGPVHNKVGLVEISQQLMLHLILKAPGVMLQEGYDERPGFSLMQRLIAEGDQLARRIGVPETWNVNTSAMPLLARYVGEHTASTVWALFVRDGDMVRVLPESQGVPVGDLVAELAGAGLKVERRSKEIWAPHVQIVQLLSNYLGTAPILGTIRGGEIAKDIPVLLDQAALL